MCGFSLSVAVYVVKPISPEFNRKKLFQKQATIQILTQNMRVLVNSQDGLEPSASSLPIDCKPGSCWHSAVSGPFCSGKISFFVLSAPLLPFTSFAVWVRLWVTAVNPSCFHTGLLDIHSPRYRKTPRQQTVYSYPQWSRYKSLHNHCGFGSVKR